MRNIGFFGGPSLFELGPVADVQLFFDCIAAFAAPQHPELDWTLLTDRFYRRYLRFEELIPAQVLMDSTRKAFERTHSGAVDWQNVSELWAVTRLDPSGPFLVEVFEKYFEAFSHCKGSAEIFFETFKQYQPLKIVISDMPAFLKDKSRLLEDYDSLDGPPFWKG